MKKNLVPLIAIAFVVALIATAAFYGLVASKLGGASEAPTYAVLVAARPLNRGSVLQAADVKIAQRPGREAPKGVFITPDQVIGFTALEPLGEEEILGDRKLASHRSIPPGMRAVSVHVTDSSGVVSLLRPGNKVDVQVISNVTVGELGLRTMLQNIEVLTPAVPDNNRPVVTLLAKPADAELLGLADSAARVRLVLRNSSDEGTAAQATLPVSALLHRSAEETAKPARVAAAERKLTAFAAAH
ncbi:MAG TPA: Flp pilus assembly protein CpaB [Bryobacteraceae bacterium]|nr:Flp pilus assembly protein CpaB [Bryobacteraceae bacterium]